MWRAVSAFVTIATSLVAALAADGAAAYERIQSFRSEITIRTDGWVDVHETIAVIAEGYEIRRGIYRDFPPTIRTATAAVSGSPSRLRRYAATASLSPIIPSVLPTACAPISAGRMC